MKAKTRKNKRTGNKMTAAEKLEPAHWWQPQLNTPVGRVELEIFRGHTICVRRAGWLNLKSHRRLTQHHDIIGLIRDPKTGHWRPADAYRNVHDRRIAQMLAEAVTAWAAANDDRLRRCMAFNMVCRPDLHGGVVLELGMRCGALLKYVQDGALDFADAGHARALVFQAVDRLKQMRLEVIAMEDEIRQAITPATEDKAAA